MNICSSPVQADQVPRGASFVNAGDCFRLRRGLDRAPASGARYAAASIARERGSTGRNQTSTDVAMLRRQQILS
jgi:hypothetical protein